MHGFEAAEIGKDFLKAEISYRNYIQGEKRINCRLSTLVSNIIAHSYILRVILNQISVSTFQPPLCAHPQPQPK